MKKLSLLIVIVAMAIFLFLSQSLSAESKYNPMLHAKANYVVNANNSPILLRCVNLSPWLNREPYLIRNNLVALFKSPSEFEQKLAQLVGVNQAEKFWQHWEESFVTENDFKHLSQQGFNCVRLPLNHKKIVVQKKNGSVTLNKAGMASVDRAVVWGQKHKIFVIIDLHTAPGGQNNLATVADILSNDLAARLWEGSSAKDNQKQVIQLWREIATRYAQSRSVGGYDLLNEPKLPNGVPKTSLLRFYDKIIATIRSVDPNHMVILEGDDFARDFSAFTSPVDHNVMFEFHEYSLFNENWNNPNQEALEPFLKVRSSFKVPLWLGEFGEGTLEWQVQMLQLMKTNQIGWAIWPWKRVYLGEGRPVIQTIQTTDAWNNLADYLLEAPFSSQPTPEQAQQGMLEMLAAIQSAHCKEDHNLAALFNKN